MGPQRAAGRRGMWILGCSSRARRRLSTIVPSRPFKKRSGASLGLAPDQLDLRIINDADPVFLGRMLAGGVRVYESNREARVQFEARAVARWLAFTPVWERMRGSAAERWSRG